MIVVGTVVAPRAMSRPYAWGTWLANAADLGPDVTYFAALQVDRQGLAPFEPLIGDDGAFARLDDAGIASEWWPHRPDGPTTGRDLAEHFAASERADHLLFLAADTPVEPALLDSMLTGVRAA